MPALQWLRYNSCARTGGGNVASRAWDFNFGCGGNRLGAGTNETFREMGRVDGGGVSRSDRQGAGYVPAAVRDPGKARTAFAAGDGPVAGALCYRACCAAGVRADFSGILFW